MTSGKTADSLEIAEEPAVGSRRARTKSGRMRRDFGEIQGIKTHMVEYCLHCSLVRGTLKQADSGNGEKWVELLGSSTLLLFSFFRIRN